MTKASKIVWFLFLAIFLGWLTHRAFGQMFQRSLPFLAKSTAGSGPFSPNSIPGSYGWYVADDYFVDAFGVAMTNRNFGGVGLSMSNEILGVLPVYTANALNGHAILTFTNDAHLGSIDYNAPQPHELFLVMYQDLMTAANPDIGTVFDGGTKREVYYVQSNGAGTTNMNIYAGTVVTIGQYVPFVKWFVLDVLFNGSSSQVFTNAVQCGLNVDPGTNGLVLFQLGKTAEICRFRIAEMLTYTNTLGTTAWSQNRSNVYFYLTNKFNLTP